MQKEEVLSHLCALLTNVRKVLDPTRGNLNCDYFLDEKILLGEQIEVSDEIIKFIEDAVDLQLRRKVLHDKRPGSNNIQSEEMKKEHDTTHVGIAHNYYHNTPQHRAGSDLYRRMVEEYDRS